MTRHREESSDDGQLDEADDVAIYTLPRAIEARRALPPARAA
jgi:hypothetical protein